tara:strand:- start:256 stop:459 length:204 start_codon:yes stop_codon:yes gene_type:complete
MTWKNNIKKDGSKLMCFNKKHTDLTGDDDSRPPVEMEKWDEKVPREYKAKLQHWHCPKCDTQIATPR